MVKEEELAFRRRVCGGSGFGFRVGKYVESF